MRALQRSPGTGTSGSGDSTQATGTQATGIQATGTQATGNSTRRRTGGARGRAGPGTSGPAGSPLPGLPAVPGFAPVRPRGGRHRLRRLLHGRRRLAALVLAAAAAVLTLLVADTGVRAAPPAAPASAAAPAAPDDRRVAVPVRIADPAVARLVAPGDRVDVLAASAAPGRTPGPAAVVARRALVTEVHGADAGDLATGASGTVLVLSVAPGTAADVAGAAAAGELAVARW